MITTFPPRLRSNPPGHRGPRVVDPSAGKAATGQRPEVSLFPSRAAVVRWVRRVATGGRPGNRARMGLL